MSSRQKYLKHCQTFKTQRFARKNNRNRNQDSSINFSSKTQEQQTAQGNILEFFLSDTLKTTFLTHYSPVLLIYLPLKYPKTFMFSEGYRGIDK